MLPYWLDNLFPNKPRRRRPPRPRLEVESFETRIVPTVNPFVDGAGVLQVSTDTFIDDVTIDHTVTSLGPTTLVNQFQFLDSRFRSINIQGEFQQVSILATSKPLTANGNHEVIVGSTDVHTNTGTLQNILAPLSLTSDNVVTLDDSNDPFGRNVTLNVVNNVAQVTGMAPAPISITAFGADIFGNNDLQLLQIVGGRGRNTFKVLDTPEAFRLISQETSTDIDTGPSGDQVNVLGTHSAALSINGQARDTVDIGNNGNLANIQSLVGVANSGGSLTSLIVDGSTAGNSQNVTLSLSGGVSLIHGLAPQDISGDLGSLSSLTVKGGPHGNTFTVADTESTATTTVDTGSGSDQVFVDNTHGQLFLNSLGGPAAVNIGNRGSLQGIRGAIHIFNSPNHSTVNIDESADLVNHNFELYTSGTQGVIDGLGFVAPIFYNPGDIHAITLTSGEGNEGFLVQSTVGGFPITINGFGASDQFIVGYGTDSLDHINNPLTLNGGAGFDTLLVDDQNAATGHRYSDDHFSQITRDFGAVTINYSVMSSEQLIPSPLPPPPLTFIPDPGFPAATDLALTGSIRAGQHATLSGRLTDADPREVLSLSVNWGDGTPLAQSTPNRAPFHLTHRYVEPGTYKVRATWRDSFGRSKSRDLLITVKPAHKGH